jgi:hypothetical protein
MAPQLFGVPQNFLNKVFDVGSRESYDPQRGVKPGTLASMINRFHNPNFGSSGSWLNSGQYEVLKSRGLDPGNPAIQKAQQYYSTPEGQQELFNYAKQLGGVTDFRGTKYLKDTNNLLNYPTNLIPAIVQGQRRFLTPAKLKELGATPDLTENTFFNETSRPPTKPWWNSGAPATAAPLPTRAAPAASAPGQRSVEDILGSALGLTSKPALDKTKDQSQSLLDSFKTSIIKGMIQPLIQGTINPFGLMGPR